MPVLRPTPCNAALLIAATALASTFSTHAQTPREEADRLDATAWQSEVAAAPYSAAIASFWDAVAKSPDQILALAGAPAESIAIPSTSRPPAPVATGITRTDFTSDAWTTLPKSAFKKTLRGYTFDGWNVEQTSWHHTAFRPGSPDSPPSSQLTFEIGASNALLESRALLRGDIDIVWSSSTPPVATSAQVSRLTVLKREGSPAFLPFMQISPPAYAPGADVIIAPLIVTDIDGDGRSDILNGGSNGVLFNRGDGSFDSDRLFAFPSYLQQPGIVADFNSDAKPDFVGVTERGKLALFDGADGIPFPNPHTDCWDGPALEAASVITAGDVDGDGDLDLWIGQYKTPYAAGNFPTPYHDANDGFPSFLLLNNGKGTFTDNTLAAGLSSKHLRRVSTASLVDLDGDGDLDLLTVSDYAGLDAYHNDGSGRFSDATSEHFTSPHRFGLGHTLADFNHDGHLDLFTLGRSSTAADRMAALGLKGPPGFPGQNAHRAAMASGNQLLLASPSAPFSGSPIAVDLAKTGWPWDTASLDFDNDADLDVFVTNGNITGETSRDYDTDFWRHDIYLGKSRPTPELQQFFSERFDAVSSGNLSWAGLQPDVLAIDTGAGGFIDVAFLMGVAQQSDNRSAIAEDFNGDGTVDLAVIHTKWADGHTTLYQSLALYLNKLKTANHWIAVSLHSDVPGIPTIGATVTATVAGKTRTHHVVTGDGYRCQSPAVAHFGLGETDTVDAVTVRWPNGQTSTLTNPQIDTRHVVRPPR